VKLKDLIEKYLTVDDIKELLSGMNLSRSGQKQELLDRLLKAIEGNVSQSKLSEERFSQAFNLNPVPMLISTLKESRILSVNHSFLDVIGYSREEVAGRKMPDLNLFIDPGQWIATLSRLKRVEQVSNIDISVRRKDGGIREWSFSAVKINHADTPCLLTVMVDVTERKKIEHQFQERIKELQAFYRLSDIAQKKGITIEDLYQEVANFLPESWQYPDVTCARIVIGNKEFRTENFKDTTWKQSAPVRVFDAIVGSVDVAYLEEKAELDEGPFMKEERLLIDAIAERIGHITELKLVEESIKK
jgi:PAS domain S-box-containing protein